jgi:acyl-coenzyme A synthetase/AMP-(fatty) acid ligase
MSPNLADLLSAQAAARPDAPAVLRGGLIVGFADFDAMVWRAATALSHAGVGRGVVAGLTFTDELAHLVVACALARVGATQVSMPSGEPPLVKADIATRTRMQVLVSDDRQASVPGLAHHLFDAQRALAASAPVESQVRDPAPHAPWLVMIGSGTTGRSKCMPLGHAAWQARQMVQRAMLGLVAGEPAASIASLEFATTRHRYLETLSIGGTVVLFNRAREGLRSICERHRVRILYASTVHLQRLVDALPEGTRHWLPGLRVLRVGNSTVSDDLRRRAMLAVTAQLHVAYSTNEFGPATVASPAAVAITPGTVGRPGPGVELGILDDEGRPCGPGQIGRIALRGPGCIDGYLDDDEATRRAFASGWFLPGDLGELAADGQLLHRGRCDDMMILDGINIFPDEIEAVVSSHPSVREAVAFALRSEASRDVPAVAVTPAAGLLPEAAEVLSWAAARLGSRAPRHVFVVDEIPSTASGKPLRRTLAQRFGGAAQR